MLPTHLLKMLYEHCTLGLNEEEVTPPFFPKHLFPDWSVKEEPKPLLVGELGRVEIWELLFAHLLT